MSKIPRSAHAERECMQQLVLAANPRFAQGDATLLPALCSQREEVTLFEDVTLFEEVTLFEDVTLFDGAGGYERRGKQVGPRDGWARANFAGGHLTSLACTVELERWDVRFASTGAAATIDRRVTPVYRRKEDAWTLIHRHADRLTPKERGDSLAER